VEGLGLLLLLWIISTIFEKVRDAQRKTRGGEPPMPRPRRQERVEQGRWRRPATPPPPTPAESAEEEWRKELERVFGIPGQTGPVGRRADVELSGAEEVEDAESLETEPELVNIDEVALELPARVSYDEDAGAEELVRRRIKAGEDRSHALTKADHVRFDRSIRVAAPAAAAADRTGVARRQARLSVREAFVWKEILDKPVGLRPPE